MKEFYVTLGGKEHQVKYSIKDMKALQRQHGFGAPADFIIGSVLGISMSPPSNTSWDLSAQQSFLAAGIARGTGKSYSVDHVEKWWDEALEKGEDLKAVLWEAVRAAYFSGVVTMESTDIEEKGASLKALFFAKTQEDVLRIAELEAKPLSQMNPTRLAIVASDNP